MSTLLMAFIKAKHKLAVIKWNFTDYRLFMSVNPQAETERVCCQVPKALVDQMKAMAEHQQASYADFYRQCLVTGFYQIAEGYNKVLVNQQLRNKKIKTE